MNDVDKKCLIPFAIVLSLICLPIAAQKKSNEYSYAIPENLINVPENFPHAISVKPIPIENVRPPDLTVPQENFENLSPYQAYVTPYAPAVQNLARGVHNVKGAYHTAVIWVWVSDTTLNGLEEKWLYPQEFLTDTPNYPTNPASGRVASDCESQAYTMVSLIRAIGVPPEYARVAVGKVRFGDQEGGHAWVEIYVENRWMALEATSGPYWDDDNHRLVERDGIPYDYFASNEYPAIEVWAYFNDAYYYNTSTGEGNAPEHWRTSGPRLGFNWLLMALFLILFAALAALVVQIALIMRERKRRTKRR